MRPRALLPTTLTAPLLTSLLLMPAATIAATSDRASNMLFERADTDHNQLISEAEYHAAMQRRFERLDSNKDGNLTRQEMEQARANARDRLQGGRGGSGRLAN